MIEKREAGAASRSLDQMREISAGVSSAAARITKTNAPQADADDEDGTCDEG